MERFRSISPESSNSAFSWRKTLRTRGSILNRDDKCNLLTSSLPSSLFSKEMEIMNLRKITSQNQIIEDVDCRHRHPIYKGEELKHNDMHHIIFLLNFISSRLNNSETVNMGVSPVIFNHDTSSM